MKRFLAFVLLVTLAAPTPAFAAPAKTKLTIKADLADGAGLRTWVLNCDFSVGNHPNRNAACALLKKKGTTIFKPVPADAACTMQYGGDQKVTVTGIVNKKKVSATFNRSGGCEIARYDAAEPLFTIPNTQVVYGFVQLDGQPSAAPVVFTNSRKSATSKATVERGFAIRLELGTWVGSAGSGLKCVPVQVTVPADPSPLTITCTSPKS